MFQSISNKKYKKVKSILTFIKCSISEYRGRKKSVTCCIYLWMRAWEISQLCCVWWLHKEIQAIRKTRFEVCHRLSAHICRRREIVTLEISAQPQQQHFFGLWGWMCAMLIIQAVIPPRFSSLKPSSFMHCQFESSNVISVYFICGRLSHVEHTHQQYHHWNTGLSPMETYETFMFILPATSIKRPSKLSVNTKQKVTVATVTESVSQSYQCRRVGITFHYIIHNVQSLCHFKFCFPGERTNMPTFTQATAWNKSSGAAHEQYLNKLKLTKHLPCVTVCTLQPMSDLHRAAERRGAGGVSRDPFPTTATTVCSGPSLSVNEVWEPGAEVPEGLYSVTYVRNRIQLGTQHAKSSQTVPAWITASIRNIYRSDTLTAVNDNWPPLCWVQQSDTLS